jgi:hypothetical protein
MAPPAPLPGYKADPQEAFSPQVQRDDGGIDDPGLGANLRALYRVQYSREARTRAPLVGVFAYMVLVLVVLATRLGWLPSPVDVAVELHAKGLYVEGWIPMTICFAEWAALVVIPLRWAMHDEAVAERLAWGSEDKLPPVGSLLQRMVHRVLQRLMGKAKDTPGSN